MRHRRLLDAEQAEVHRLLGRHVAVRAGLAEEPIIAKKLKKPILADVQTILAQHLRQFADKARAVRSGHRVGEQGFRLQHLDLRVLFSDLPILMLDGLLRDEHGPGHDVLIRIRLGRRDVAAGFADGRKDLVSHPTLEALDERLRLRFFHIGGFAVED